MKQLTVFILLITTSFSFGQITPGSNYFSIGNTVFNKPFTKFDQYPDTLAADTTKKTSSSGSVSMMLSYHVAVARHFSVGLRTRVLTNSNSSYGISCVGGAVRYHFGFGPDEPKPRKLKEGQSFSPNDMLNKVRRFYHGDERLKSLFFLEAGYMVGKLRYDANKIDYSEMSFQAGAVFRAPLHDTKFLRHFGLELSAGVFGMSDEFEKLNFRPNVSAGLLIFLDRKYTRTKVVFREAVYPE